MYSSILNALRCDALSNKIFIRDILPTYVSIDIFDARILDGYKLLKSTHAIPLLYTPFTGGNTNAPSYSSLTFGLFRYDWKIASILSFENAINDPVRYAIEEYIVP